MLEAYGLWSYFIFQTSKLRMISFYLQSRYRRLYRRVRDLLQSGRFGRLTHRRRSQLLQRLHRYEIRLSRLGISVMTTAALFAGSVELQAQAQPVGDPVQLIGDYVSNPYVATDSDGDFVVGWIDEDSTGYALKVQRYDDMGAPDGAAITVATDGIQYQTGRISIDLDDDGDFAIAWQYYGDPSFNQQIRVRKYDGQNNPLTDEVLVEVESSFRVISPSVAMDDDGDFVVAWGDIDYGQDSGSIYTRRFNSDGTPAASATAIGSISGVAVLVPPVVAMDDDDGSYVVGWQNDSVRIQRFDAMGVADGDVVAVAEAIGGFEATFLGLDMNDNGDLIVAWAGKNDGDERVIYGRQYNSANPQGGAIFQVNTNTEPWQAQPHAAINSAGDFVITWISGDVTTDFYQAPYYRQYDATGTPIGGEVLITEVTDGQNTEPVVALDDNGDFVIAWYNAGDEEGFFQRFGIPSSLSPVAADKALILYPNPATDRLYLQDALPGLVVVYDALGRMVHDATLIGSQNSIDVSTLRSGQYVLIHTDEAGAVSTAKFVK